MDTEGMDIMENLLFSAGRNTIFNLQLETSKCKWSIIPASHPTWSYLCDESCVCQVCVCVCVEPGAVTICWWPGLVTPTQLQPAPSSLLLQLPAAQHRQRAPPTNRPPVSHTTVQCQCGECCLTDNTTPPPPHWWPVVNYIDVMMTTVMMTWWHQMTSQLWPICCHFCDLQNKVLIVSPCPVWCLCLYNHT